jgi:cysteine desulfurase
MSTATLYVDQAARGYPTLFPIDSQKNWANPSSLHRYGRDAKAALNQARQDIAQSLSLTFSSSQALAKQIIFTSGGTESNNLVILQPTWRYIVTTATEHHAVFYPAQYMANHTTCEVVFLPVDGQGKLRDMDQLRQLLSEERFRSGPGLVSLAYVNNETGNVLDVAAIGRIIAASNAKRGAAERTWFHTDAVQAPGHVPLNMGQGALSGVDFMSFSAHKFHGPSGIGMLVCRSTSPLRQPLMFGGNQQGGLRPGTEPVGAILAMASAFQDINDPAKLGKRVPQMRALTDTVWSALMPFIVSGTVLPTGCTNPEERACHHVSFCVRGAHRNDLVASLETESGVLVSGGSACSADYSLHSHVLDAMRVPLRYIHGSIRITISHLNTTEEVSQLLVPALVKLLEKRVMFNEY